MIEKYYDIDPQHARQLIAQVKNAQWSKRGIDRHAYLLEDYAVLSTKRLLLRNVITRDDDLRFLDEIIQTLLDLHQQGVSVVPILGYCYDPNSTDRIGFMIQKRAKGLELYDDAAMARFQTWAQSLGEDLYLRSNMRKDEEVAYLLSRTQVISQVPQAHFHKFVSDILRILQHDILIDAFGKSNFFYDSNEGFQFIDLDSHNDYKYGLTNQKPNIEELASICAFVPCHYASDTSLFASNALDDHALLALTDAQQQQLAEDNSVIFQKCIEALKYNGISDASLNNILSRLKAYGIKNK